MMRKSAPIEENAFGKSTERRGKKTRKLKRIGVLMGGQSSEREVSLKSGAAIYRALISMNYDAVAIDVGHNLWPLLKKKKIDIAFIALHGGYGENGAIQGMLEIMNIPYTGSGVLASALAMDKEASKKIFLHHGIPIPPFRIIRRAERANGRGGRGKGPLKRSAVRIREFSLPWVVKPAAEGSSIGVEIVRSHSGVSDALTAAFSYGHRAIIEKYIKGQEVQIGILHDRILGGVEVKPSLEFYNYRAKYTAGLTEYLFPPQINKRTYEKAKNAALSAHRALGCRGATRVDLIIDSEGRPFVLEVNTIPGMTETSLLPKIARQAGLEFPSLIEEILQGVPDAG